MVASVLSDIPRTVVVAFTLTLGTVLLAFQRGFYSLLVIGSQDRLSSTSWRCR
jgi:hypothetical protein